MHPSCFSIEEQVFSDQRQTKQGKLIMNHSKARPAPEWLENGIIYQINLRAFTPEGTLNAAKTKLEHVRSCGATIVYLMPVYKSDGDMDRKYWSERQ